MSKTNTLRYCSIVGNGFGTTAQSCAVYRKFGVYLQSTKLVNRRSSVAAMAKQEVSSSKITSLEVKEEEEKVKLAKLNGKYGKFGGKFMPETLINWLTVLEHEFKMALHDPQFQEELATALREYVGRETPLYYAKRLTEYYREKNKGVGPEIYLKREDLCHAGSHKINNAIAQVMLAKRLGKKKIYAATGAGQHGVAAACAKHSLECVVFMGSSDMDRQSSNVQLIELLGAQVQRIDGSFKEAASEAFKGRIANLEDNFLLIGTVVGPHPCPAIVREFQSVIGKEVRRQSMQKWGGKPDALVACVGSGSNALGLFHDFIDDHDVRLIGVEAAGFGLESGRHSATLTKGSVGVHHGAMTYLLQDDEGQIVGPHSIGVGLEYPSVGPELSYLKEMERAEFRAVTDDEALHAFNRLCKLEGIFTGLESAHALAYLEELCPTMASGAKVVVNLSGRGDKDVTTVFQCNLVN
ncbi:hypothetical protein V2J09_019298 [Rumex salicifolius]